MSQSTQVSSPAAQPAKRLAPSARIWEIDALRGVAVILMIYFHLMWDLQFNGMSQVNVFSAPWQFFARSIGTTFTFLLGLSLYLVSTRLPNQAALWRYSLRRGGIIFAMGMVVTIATFFALGDDYVRFGILHLLGLTLILATPFVFLPIWLSIASGILAMALGFWFNTLVVPFSWLIWLGLLPASIGMADYYPLLPWGGAALIGIGIGKLAYPRGQRAFPLINLAEVAPIRGLRFLGRHSLVIYLAHQPLILGVLWLISALGA